MQFYVKEKDETLLGPVDEETLKAWVDADKIFPKTPIKNTIFPNWKNASEYPFLNKSLADQKNRLGEDHPEINPELAELNTPKGKLKSFFSKKKTAPLVKKGTSFRNEFSPNPPGLGLRLQSAIFDIIVVLLIGGAIGLVGTGVAFNISSSYTDSASEAISEEIEARKAADEAAKKALEAKRKAEEKEAKRKVAEADGREYIEDEEPAAKEDAKEKAPSFMAKLNAKLNSAMGGIVAKNTWEKVDPIDEYESQGRPSIVDDERKGFHAGSKWTNLDSGETYVCIRASQNAARWCLPSRLNPVFYYCVSAWILCTLLYLGLSLALRAQTLGMWFWGLFITRDSDFNIEVKPLRAYLFMLLSVFLGITMPVFVLMRRPTIYEKLLDIQLIRISSK